MQRHSTCGGVQVKVWDRNKLFGFWQKWYFPANATLFIVGDISSPSALRDACLLYTSDAADE